VVLVIDGDDPEGDATKSDAIAAANELAGAEVRFWIISVTKRPDLSGFPAEVEQHVLTLGQSGTDEFLDLVKKTLYRQMFPRLIVTYQAPANGRRLPDPTRAKMLSDFVAGHQGQLRIGVPLGQMKPIDAHPLRDRTFLWTWHWKKPMAAPLMVQSEADLGDNKKMTTWQLAIDVKAETARTSMAQPGDDQTAERNALASLLIRTVSATTTELYRPTIYWFWHGAGIGFFRADYKPFTIEEPATAAAAKADPKVGGRLTNRPGHTPRPGHIDVDDRRLDQVILLPRGLGEEPAVFEPFIEDDDPKTGRSTPLQLALTAPPPRPVSSGPDLDLLRGSSPALPSTPPPPSPRWGLSAGQFRVLVAALWVAVALLSLMAL